MLTKQFLHQVSARDFQDQKFIGIIQTAADLRQAIAVRYASNRAFCIAFEQATGVKLDETTLSRQLSGRVALSGFALAAYRLFFDRVAV